MHHRCIQPYLLSLWVTCQGREAPQLARLTRELLSICFACCFSTLFFASLAVSYRATSRVRDSIVSPWISGICQGTWKGYAMDIPLPQQPQGGSLLILKSISQIATHSWWPQYVILRGVVRFFMAAFKVRGRCGEWVKERRPVGESEDIFSFFSSLHCKGMDGKRRICCSICFMCSRKRHGLVGLKFFFAGIISSPFITNTWKIGMNRRTAWIATN